MKQSYYEKTMEKDEKNLNRQRDRALRKCKRIIKLLSKREMTFGKDMDFIERRIIPYIKTWKWIPPSYNNMLDDLKERFLYLKEK